MFGTGSIVAFNEWLGQYGLIMLPVALGFLCVWLLLPQPRRRSLLFGTGVGATALFLTGAMWIVPMGWTVENVLFYLFSGISIVSGVSMIVQHNPVYAALWFALVILSTCGLFLLQSAQFLAAATIIVYAGAIIVTFLFVIMLAQQTGVAVYDRLAREPFMASLGGWVLLSALLHTFHLSYWSQDLPPEKHSHILELPYDARLQSSATLTIPARAQMGRSDLSQPRTAGHVASLGQSLFSDYLWAVELAGTLLLVATIGAIAICARREEVGSP